MEKRYLSCADTAKLVRQALKEAFPGIKFSVRSDTYSGGASIDIGWTDGPNTAQVEAVVGVFKGAYFDGMIDYKGTVTCSLDGKPVSFGADFIFTNRKYSDDMLARACDAVATKYAGNIKALAGTLACVDDWPALFRLGKLYGLQLTTSAYGGMELQSLINGDLAKRSTCLAQPSATAARAAPLYDDGYGQGPYGAADGDTARGYPRPVKPIYAQSTAELEAMVFEESPGWQDAEKELDKRNPGDARIAQGIGSRVLQ